MSYILKLPDNLKIPENQKKQLKAALEIGEKAVAASDFLIETGIIDKKTMNNLKKMTELGTDLLKDIDKLSQ